MWLMYTICGLILFLIEAFHYEYESERQAFRLVCPYIVKNLRAAELKVRTSLACIITQAGQAAGESL